MNARLNEPVVSHDITFCVSECKKKCWRHISRYDIKSEFISMAYFNCDEKETKE